MIKTTIKATHLLCLLLATCSARAMQQAITETPARFLQEAPPVPPVPPLDFTKLPKKYWPSIFPAIKTAMATSRAITPPQQLKEPKSSIAKVLHKYPRISGN